MKFEDKLIKLEQIAEKIKDESETIENTISSFEEGMSLAIELEKELNSYEKRVKILIEKNGLDQLEDFK